MYARDRLFNLWLLAGAVVAWVGVAILFVTRSPVGDTTIQAAAAVLLGMAVALTAAPIFWLVAFARRHRIAYRGDWARAGRRALLLGSVATMLMLLRVLGVFSLPLALFVVAMALFVELILTARR